MLATIGLILLKSALVILALDLFTGLLHWLEDSYGSPDWWLLGPTIIQPNIKHHFEPRWFTKQGFWNRNNSTIIISTVSLAVIALAGWWRWEWALFFGVGAFANEYHCWAHRTRKENGLIISFLQDTGLLQSSRQHAIHHTDPKDRAYCTVTSVWNPLLDGIQIWSRMERVLLSLTGLERRPDPSVNPARKPARAAQ